MKTFAVIGALAGIILPLFNIPLILRIIKRKSSDDISLVWLFGVWICIILMTPAAMVSPDFAFCAYTLVNLIFFTIVVVVTLRYRHKKYNDKNASDR